MVKYNGDAESYMQQTQQEYEAKLAEIYQQAVQKSQEADKQIESIVGEFTGLHTANIDAQQALDKQFAEHMIGLGQRQDEMQAETDHVYDRMKGCLNHLETYRANGGDVESLNRLYYDS